MSPGAQSVLSPFCPRMAEAMSENTDSGSTPLSSAMYGCA